MRSLTVRGPFHGPTGHDRHVREFVRELHKQGLAIQLIDLPQWSPARLPPDMLEPFFDGLAAPCDSQTVLHFCMPHQVARVSGKLNANFTMFEANRVPASWIGESRKHDLVIVPSESSREAWIRSGLPMHRIHLCPLGINPAMFDGTPEPMALTLEGGESISDYRTRVLNVSELSPRKNLPGLLEAWTLATSPADDAALIVKLGCYETKPLQLLQQKIERMEARIGKRLADAAPVRMLSQTLADGEMPALYAAATHYISLSFGEGWDQAAMEAGASGLNVIAPDHSGYREYLDSTVATMLPCREAIAAHDGDPATAALFEGACWWEPDLAAAVAAIRRAVDDAAAKAKDGERTALQARLLERFTWEKATLRLREVLSEAEELRAKIPIFSSPR